MKTALRVTLISLGALLLCAAVALPLFFEGREHRDITCTGLTVHLTDPDLHFVSEEDVQRYLKKHYGEYMGQRLDSVKLFEIEKLLQQKSVVLGSEAWLTRNGVLHVSVTQRAPAIRFERGQDGFYVDAQGVVFPLHKTFTADVPLISGDIPYIERGESPEWKASALALVNAIQDSKFLRDRVDEIEVCDKGDFVLTTHEGEERFLLGGIDELESKFNRLEKYYTHILPYKGKDFYKTVILKYNNQIICRRDS